MTLVEFLTARLDEDEAAAMTLVQRSAAEPQLLAHRPLQTWIMDHPTIEAREVMHRVLADVDAKRRIVAEYAEHADYDNLENSYEHATGRIVGLGEALRYLALPYADHPDYDQGWKP